MRLAQITPLWLCIVALVTACASEPEGNRQADSTPRASLAQNKSRQPGGFWRKSQESTQSPQADEESDSEAAKLSSLGYLNGYRPANSESGVLVRVSEKMAPGVTLFSSGHEPVAILLSADGKQLHSWSGSFQEYFPDAPLANGTLTRGMQYWRYVRMLPNGDLLAIFEGEALVKLDAESRLIWGKLNRAHHDLELQPNGDILTLSRSARREGKRTVIVDELLWLNSNGEELKKLSILDALLASPYRDSMVGKAKLRGDVLHTNSIQTLRGPPGSFPPGVKQGDILLSMRNIKALAILNPESGKIVWTHRGPYYRQHYARVLGDGRLILFDNGKKRSRVMFYHWPAMTVESTIETLPGNHPLNSPALGLARILPNGNTLIVESYNGRLYELTPARELVWEYATPFRAGDRNELIAVLAHARRYPPEYAPRFAQ